MGNRKKAIPQKTASPLAPDDFDRFHCGDGCMGSLHPGAQYSALQLILFPWVRRDKLL
jgi:hypothetical protein